MFKTLNLHLNSHTHLQQMIKVLMNFSHLKNNKIETKFVSNVFLFLPLSLTHTVYLEDSKESGV